MSEIDAAELARLREMAANQKSEYLELKTVTIRSLIDALEKARGDAADERDINHCHCVNVDALTKERDQAEAERDSARALLRETLDDPVMPLDDDLRARIAKELAQ